MMSDVDTERRCLHANEYPPHIYVQMEQCLWLIQITLQLIPSIICFARIVNRSFHRLKQFNLSDCKSLPCFTDYCDQRRQGQSERTNCLILGREMFILYERIPYPRERLARFDVIIEYYPLPSLDIEIYFYTFVLQ